MRNLTMTAALHAALREEMQADESVIVFGEDIAVYGGVYGVTIGLQGEFGPDRVRDTPISEMAIAGMALGAALGGQRPVVEIMYCDFLAHAADAIVNNAAKWRYMSGGQYSLPLVVRSPAGGGGRTAAQHSQCLESWFTHIPGLKVVMPSVPRDARGLLRAAIRDDNPVVFIEHKYHYGYKGDVPAEGEIIPLGVADRNQPRVSPAGRPPGWATARCTEASKMSPTTNTLAIGVSLSCAHSTFTNRRVLIRKSVTSSLVAWSSMWMLARTFLPSAKSRTNELPATR